MASQKLNPRLAKIHHSYSVDEIARLYGVHKNTVRSWIKLGLPVIDRERPALVRGQELADFLDRRRKSKKYHCLPGEIFCVRCRLPKMPAGDMAELQVTSAKLGNLIGLCPTCEKLMYRRVSLARLHESKGHLDVSVPQAKEHISESCNPSLNCDFTT